MASPPDGTLQFATSEAVAVELEVAGLGYRALAWLIDAALLLTFWFTLLFLLTYVLASELARVAELGPWLQGLLVLGAFATNWLYALLFEALWGGRTPGKRLMGLRVVRLDGSPATPLDLALRNFARGIDFLPAFYAVGVVSMLVSEQGRRLGDRVAGTLVVRDREFDLGRYRDLPRVAGLELSTEELELVLAWLRREGALLPEARDALALQFAERFRPRVAESERAALGTAEGARALLHRLASGV